MTNKEWLENVKRVDEKKKPSDLIPIYEFRKAKALEIIAEELIKLNKTISELKKYDILVKYGHEQERTETGDWEVRVKKDEKEANE